MSSKLWFRGSLAAVVLAALASMSGCGSGARARADGGATDTIAAPDLGPRADAIAAPDIGTATDHGAATPDGDTSGEASAPTEGGTTTADALVDAGMASDGVPGGDGPPPRDGAPVAFTPAQRTVVLNALSDVMASLAGEQPAAVDAGLLAFLRSRPELSGTAVTSAGNLVSYFPDGAFLFLIRNLEAAYASDLGLPPPPSPPPALGQPRTPPLAAAPAMGGVPGNKRAVVMTAIGGVLESSPLGDSSDAANDVQSYLSDAGYDAAPLEPSLANMREMRQFGIVYLHTHGGVLTLPDGSTNYTLMTSTTRDEALETTDQTLAFELAYGMVGFAVTPIDAVLSSKLHIDAHPRYAFTSKFVDYHWSLAAPAMVFLNACESMQDAAQPMVNAVHKAGASLVLGWNDEVDNGTGQIAARYLFDRMLGANEFRAESPKQRPFDYQAVLDDMDAQKLSQSSVLGTGGTVHDAHLLAVGDGKLTLLAPSISYAEAVDDDQGTITIHGLFDTKSSEIFVGAADDGTGGHELGGCTFQPDQATCNISPEDSGYLVAAANDIRGNPVHLTSWHVPLHYTAFYEYGMPSSDAVTKVEATMHIRADVHTYRDRPHVAPLQPMSADLIGAKDSMCSYSCSGSYLDQAAHGTGYLSGSGSIPITTQMVNFNSDDGCFFGGQMDYASGHYLMGFFVAMQNGITIMFVGSDGSTETGMAPVVVLTAPKLGDVMTDEGLPARTVTFSGHALQGGQSMDDVTDNTGIVTHLELRWDTAPPDESPSDKTPR